MVRTLTTEGALSWTDVAAATAEELAEFARSAALQPADAEFVVHDHHRPEVTIQPGYIMILIRVPAFDRHVRITTGVPLYLVIRPDRIWTVHHQSLPVLDKIYEDYEAAPDKLAEYASDGAAALGLHLLGLLYASAFTKLDRLAKHIDIAEDAVFNGNERKMVEEVAVLTRDIMDFRKVMRPQTKLYTVYPGHPLLTDAVANQWLRLHSQVNRLWDMLEGLLESAKELAYTNKSLLQHKENELLRLLTIYSIVIIPLWILVAPIDPFRSDATGLDHLFFWGTLGALIIALLAIFIRFRGKRIL